MTSAALTGPAEWADSSSVPRSRPYQLRNSGSSVRRCRNCSLRDSAMLSL